VVVVEQNKEMYQIGQIVYGKVTGIEPYGIFLAFSNDYTGLIHISELSDHFVKNVADYANMGDEIPCVVLECDHSKRKLKCSIKNTNYGREKDDVIDHGFAPLKKQLPIWMSTKLQEYGWIERKKE